MPTLNRKVRAKLRIESLEDRCVWSVGFAATPDLLTLPNPLPSPLTDTLPSTTLQGELVSATSLPVNWLTAPIPETVTTFTWNDGLVTTGTVHVADEGLLTIRTTRSLAPAANYTITFTLPATNTTEPLTFVVKVAGHARNGDATLLAPPTPKIDPVDLFNSSLTNDPSPNVPVPGEPPPPELMLIDIEVLAPPRSTPWQPSLQPTTNPNPVPTDNGNPAPPVPVVITVRIEPPLNRPGAQSPFVAGSYFAVPVDSGALLPTYWQPPSVNPQLLASTAHTVPMAPIPSLVPTFELLGIPAEHVPQVAMQTPVVTPASPQSPDTHTPTAREDRIVLTTAVAPVRVELPATIVESTTTADAILTRFASEVIIREPIAKPDVQSDEKPLRTSPLLRWLSLAVLTTVIGRTWLKQQASQSDESEFTAS